MKKTFIFPNFSSLKNVSGFESDKIVVVSIVGKSPYNSLGLKAKSIGKVFTSGIEINQESTIEGYFDEENQLLYLHLHSLLDTDVLIHHYDALLERCIESNKSDDFLVLNDEIKTNFARAFLILLHTSHIIILSNPGSTFDANYIQYFKAIDNLSQKLGPKLAKAHKELDVSPEWVHSGRFCTPRLIFYFETCPKGNYNLKKVEHNLEDRIYNVLKRTRIISSYNYSLFAIPLNEEFVFMQSKPQGDRLGNAIRGLIQDCQPGGAMHVEAPYSSQPYSESSFIKFLQVHIKQARSKGFNDTGGTGGRHQTSQNFHFELPILKKWTESAELIYDYVMNQNELVSSLCTDTRFSEQRCLKVLPLALARYQENLQPHYSHAEHERRLGMALALFNAQARGPACRQYLAKLKNDCKSLWENGKQQCEAASLTGNACQLPKHAPDEEHNSGFIYKSVCDCGRKMGPREDPYSAKQANEHFYQQMSKECNCLNLERIIFPIFQPSIEGFKAATLSEDHIEPLSILSDENRSADSTPDGEKSLVRQPSSTTEYLPGMLTLSSPPGLLPAFSSWSLVCLGPSSLYSHNLGLSEAHHPGFLNATNYLLPWDVTVYARGKASFAGAAQKFPGRGARRGRAQASVAPFQQGAAAHFTVKVFIGVEYECAAGHRFMLAGPEKMLKATPGSIVKETGHKVAESSMPLYYPCVCRAGTLAQCMRLHVVTPKAPVHCTLDARVQPAVGAPVFIASGDRPTKLTQSAYWVMRLPYVYVADRDHYGQNAGAKLLKGVFGVSEIVE